MAHTLLFEIGCEEIPARFMPGALRRLEEAAAEGLRELRLEHGPVRALGTPRRLALLVEGVASRQGEKVEEVKGPSARAAFDASGAPTRAALGFARAQGVPVEALEVRDTPQGPYVFAVRREPGRPAAEVLGPWLASLIGAVPFPKSMRWSSRLRFARPIRWIVALLDDQVIPLTVDGLVSSRASRGHRLLAPGEVTIPHAGAYVEALRQARVIVDQEERRSLIWEQVQRAAGSCGGRVEDNPELLEELTYLVEFPSALVGRFDPDYLDLPREVLVTSMEAHQRYFPVAGPGGGLLPHFIAVSNGPAEHGATIIKGNEKVLAARLADARFFFDEDRREPLEAFLPQLAQVVFQERLGTMKEKVERLEGLSGALADALGLGADQARWARRAARLAKADLVSKMVYEFPELQGIMGREYARASGEEGPVAEAIFEHMLPRFAGDRLPETPAGAVVALADRLDTLAGYFAVGLIPSGSQDPYALRRAAAGAVQIVLHHRWDLSLAPVLRDVLARYRAADGSPLFAAETVEKTAEEVLAFMRQRLRVLLMDEGCRHDVVDASLAVFPDRPAAAAERARRLQEAIDTPAMAEVVRVYQRVANLARQAEPGSRVDPAACAHPSERTLLDAVEGVAPRVEEAARRGRVAEALKILAGLAPAVDGFFEDVLVMDPDPAVRRNRLALLAAVREVFDRVADWSRVEG